MTSVEELNQDLEEFRRLLSEAKRARSKKVLSSEIQRIETEIENLKRQTTSSTVSSHSAPTILPTIKINTYAWDQSDKFLKLYVSVPGATAGQENRVRLNVNATSVNFHANDIAGKNYEFNIKGLSHPISEDGNELKVKKDQVLLLLKKKDASKQWSCVTAVEAMQNKEKSTPKMDDNEDPSSSLMKLMKKMYDEGDDEMKRNITKTWYESQQKKNAGAGDFGMGDFM